MVHKYWYLTSFDITCWSPSSGIVSINELVSGKKTGYPHKLAQWKSDIYLNLGILKPIMGHITKEGYRDHKLSLKIFFCKMFFSKKEHYIKNMIQDYTMNTTEERHGKKNVRKSQNTLTVSKLIFKKYYFSKWLFLIIIIVKWWRVK